jgi:hypothetical protein
MDEFDSFLYRVARKAGEGSRGMDAQYSQTEKHDVKNIF